MRSTLMDVDVPDLKSGEASRKHHQVGDDKASLGYQASVKGKDMKIIMAMSILELIAGVILGLSIFSLCVLVFSALNVATTRESNPAFQA